MRASEFLTEDRNSFVADQLGDKLLAAYEKDNGAKPELESPLDVVIALSAANPKLVQWLANRYIGGEFKLEDLSAIKAALERFKQVRARLHDEHKDLNKLSIGDLYRAIAPFEDKEVVSNKEAERQKKEKFMSSGAAELLYKDSTLVVVTPKTEEASCYFGKGTQWCTAATKSDNLFMSYNWEGPLYIIMTKDDGKFQVHMEKNEFNNATNEPLTASEIRALTAKYPKLYDVFDEIATNARFLPLIKNPSKQIQLAAVKHDNSALSFIETPSEEMQMAGIDKWHGSIQYINNPTEKVQWAAIKAGPAIIKHIKNPSEALQLAAVSEQGYVIQFIKNPSEAVQLAAISRAGAGFVIQFIKNPTEKVQLVAVNDSRENILHIDTPTEKVIRAAGQK